VLRGGVIEQVGAPLDLYNNPKNTFVAGFIGSPRMNFVEGAVRAEGGSGAFVSPDLPSLDLAGRSIPASIDQVTIGIRPEDFDVSTEPGNGWPATVEVLEQHGANSYLHCTLPGRRMLLIHQAGQSSARRGDILYVAPREGLFHLFDGQGLAIRPSPRAQVLR